MNPSTIQPLDFYDFHLNFPNEDQSQSPRILWNHRNPTIMAANSCHDTSTEMITSLVVYPDRICVGVAMEHNSSSGLHSGRSVNETIRAQGSALLIINSVRQFGSRKVT